MLIKPTEKKLWCARACVSLRGCDGALQRPPSVLYITLLIFGQIVVTRSIYLSPSLSFFLVHPFLCYFALTTLRLDHLDSIHSTLILVPYKSCFCFTSSTTVIFALRLYFKSKIRPCFLTMPYTVFLTITYLTHPYGRLSFLCCC